MSLHDFTKNLQPAPVPSSNPWSNAARKLSIPKEVNSVISNNFLNNNELIKEKEQTEEQEMEQKKQREMQKENVTDFISHSDNRERESSKIRIKKNENRESGVTRFHDKHHNQYYRGYNNGRRRNYQNRNQKHTNYHKDYKTDIDTIDSTLEETVKGLNKLTIDSKKEEIKPEKAEAEAKIDIYAEQKSQDGISGKTAAIVILNSDNDTKSMHEINNEIPLSRANFDEQNYNNNNNNNNNNDNDNTTTNNNNVKNDQFRNSTYNNNNNNDRYNPKKNSRYRGRNYILTNSSNDNVSMLYNQPFYPPVYNSSYPIGGMVPPHFDNSPVMISTQFNPYMNNGYYSVNNSMNQMTQLNQLQQIPNGFPISTYVPLPPHPMHHFPIVVPNAVPIPIATSSSAMSAAQISPPIAEYSQLGPISGDSSPHLYQVPVQSPQLQTPSNSENEEFNRLLKQIKYYFSVENLCKDMFLRKQMNDEGFIPVALIKGFGRVRTLTNGQSDMVDQVIDQIAEIEKREIEGDEGNYEVRIRNGWEKWVLNK